MGRDIALLIQTTVGEARLQLATMSGQRFDRCLQPQQGSLRSVWQIDRAGTGNRLFTIMLHQPA
jgi:hypothetical protein